MGMVVRTNTMAVNANRQLGMNNTQVGKSLEKLSSGFRINRAGDDASGLAISEKMKAQIKGLEQASSNSQDGISLVQTAEGALTETHDMLNRMVELATKSANGTIKDDVDRENIQSEVDALTSEINRIADSTNFNGIKLLNGNLSSKGAGGAATSLSTTLSTENTNALAGTYETANAVTAMANTENGSFTIGLSNGKSYTVNLSLKQDDSGAGATLVDDKGKEYGTVANYGTGATATELTDALVNAFKDTALGKDFKIENNAGKLKLTANTKGSGAPVVNSFGESQTTIASGAVTGLTQNVTTVQNAADAYKKFDTNNMKYYAGAAGTAGANEKKNVEDAMFTINGKKFLAVDMTKATADEIAAIGSDVTVLDVNAAGGIDDWASIISQKTGLNVEKGAASAAAGTAATDLVFKPGKGTSGSTGGLTLQIGDTAESFNKVTVSVDNMSADALGVGSIDVSTQDAAAAQIDTIKAAINAVSTNRGNLGALQNRLEHTINNLDVSAENMTAANSRIRDTDMAKEMMNYTKMNVLVQSAQAMLAQANQQPQSILQLLQ